LTVFQLERFPVDPAHVPAFEQLADERVEAARSSRGMLWADLARCTDDPPSYLLLVEWTSAEEADAFAAEHGLDGFDAVLRSEPTRRRFTSVHPA
jgi:quinol monooxygenase YgiN